MKLIVTHEQPDFDALAGLALAALAHPGAMATIGGDLPDRVEAFLRLYRDQLDLVPAEEVDLDAVSELVVVDTNIAGRLGRFAALASTLPVTLYDHHPRHDDEIVAAHGIQEPVGATATLLTRHLEASATEIPAEIASLALLGIHDDTGNLSFDLTTAEDYRAAAILMESGASLEVVREFQAEELDQDQREVLESALSDSRIEQVGGFDVAVAAFEFPRYVRDAAGACNGLLRRMEADAALMAVRMEGKTLVFARSSRNVDVGTALEEALGGGGHRGAAFARTDESPAAAVDLALTALRRHIRPALAAQDIMSSPVKTISADTTVRDAQLLLSQFGHNGVPVLDEGGNLVGIVSRRDLDRALRHDLARSAVSGFMSREVVVAKPATTVMELERLVEEHNIGRVPIVAHGNLLGIVTRSDLLAAHHPSKEPAIARKVRDRLPGEALRVVTKAADHLRTAGSDRALYLVGGTVRDALLGRALTDLDLTVERASAESLVMRLQRDLGGESSIHSAFGTSTLKLASGLAVDVAAAREEFYRRPAALPEVAPSSIRKDLARRDFTVNAMAVRIVPEPLVLIDPFDGLADLRRRTLRPLHPLSFMEDPTRILRGARLAARLGFDLSDTARAQVAAVLEQEVLERLSASRLRAELELTFAERRVAPALRLLDRLDALGAAYGLQCKDELVERLDDIRSTEQVPDHAYLYALLLGNSREAGEAHVERFHWPRRLLTIRDRLVQTEEAGSVSEEWIEEADEAERAVVRALSPALERRLREYEQVPRRRKLRGSDVLELGLPPGPAVGEVLAEVAKARQNGRVTSFEQELELARRRVEEQLDRRARE